MLGESEGTTGAATIEEIGRLRSFGRTVVSAVVLWLVQLPMFDAVGERSGDALACGVPGRLSLLVGSLFIWVYVLAAYRGYKYVRCLRQPALTRIARLGSYVVLCAGLLDAVENIVLWNKLGATSGECYGMTAGLLTWLMRLVWVVGAAMILGPALVAWRRRGKGERTAVTFRPQPETGPDEGRLVICCSGGGIRSASFCLGALQLLTEKSIYDRASSVIGVSGGGYMAAAFHIMRGKVADRMRRVRPSWRVCAARRGTCRRAGRRSSAPRCRCCSA